MEKKLFVKAEEVAKDLEVSGATGYKIIRKLNDELQVKGYIVVAGRVSRQYYEERCYGLTKRTAN